MATLLRHGAARRLGGSMVQRGRAAIADERRRLAPRRLMHTEEAHEGIEREIQQKKEELYDLIAKGENNVKTSSCWDDPWLLLHLSEHVTPRPNDSEWCDLQSSIRGFSLIRRAGVFALTILAIDGYDRYREDKKGR